MSGVKPDPHGGCVALPWVGLYARQRSQRHLLHQRGDLIAGGVTARQLHDANVAEVDFNALILKEYLDEFNGKIPA